MKTCTKCGLEKDLSEFHADAKGKHGLSAWCKVCMNEARSNWRKNNPEKEKATNDAWRAKNRERVQESYRRSWLRNAYGITLEEYEQLLALQNGGCAICGTQEDLCVDHDHLIQDVRGILCRKCNLAIGHFNDDIDLIRLAVEYLGRHQ